MGIVINIKKITNFKIKQTMSSVSSQSIIAIFEDGTELELDYITTTLSDLTITDKVIFKSRVIEILNQIYIEHIKLAMLGTEYPLYKLYTTINLECSLIGFSNTGMKLNTYTVKNFVTEIRFDNYYKSNITELTLTNKVEILSLGSNSKIKINNIEYGMFVVGTTLPYIDYTLVKNKTHILRQKHFDLNFPSRIEIKEVHELILENTCRIEDISMELFNTFPNLKKLTYSLDSVLKTIGKIEICNCLRYTLDEKCYINIDNLYNKLSETEGDRVVEIEIL